MESGQVAVWRCRDRNSPFCQCSVIRAHRLSDTFSHHMRHMRVPAKLEIRMYGRWPLCKHFVIEKRELKRPRPSRLVEGSKGP